MIGHNWEAQIREIKERTNIVDVVSGYVGLKKSGDNFTGLCPFHNEKTPSFTVNEKKGVYHCFGCGAGGDVINFLMRIKNEDFQDTVRYLAHAAGVSLTESPGDKKKDDYYSINELMANHYHQLLFSDVMGKKAFKYLTTERGLSTQTIKDYMIGYAPNGWDTAASFLRSHQVPLSAASDIGLVMKKQSGKDYYDRFRGRIMFPIKDYRARIIAFGGRMFEGEEPKYLNSPDSDIYKKGMSLYGIDIAKSHIDRAGYFIFVEGYMDTILMHQHGFKNTVATTGTAVSMYHINMVSRFSRDAVFLFDGDAAGEKAGLRTLEVIIDSAIEGRMALLPSGYDPDTLLIEQGRKAMDEIINDAQPLFEYFVKKTLTDTQNTVGGKLHAINSILTLLKKIGNSPLKQELYVQKLTELTGISELSIRDELKKTGTTAYEQPRVKPAAVNSTLLKAELILLSIIIDHPEKMHNLLGDGIINLLTNTDIIASIQQVKTLYGNGVKDIKTAVFQQDIDETKKAVFSAAMLTSLSGEDIDALYDYAVNKIKKSYYINEQRKLSKEINETRAAGRKDAPGPLLDTLLKKKKEIVASHKK